MDQKQIRFLKNLSTGLVIVAVLVAFMITGIRIFGLQVYGVLTGSMEPSYPVGSLIYVKPVDAGTLRVNDVITFSLSPGTIATHRIVEIVPDETYPSIIRYRTKGDANNDVDPSLVSQSNIIGKALFAIPHLGNLANYIQQPPGIYVAIVVCGLLIAFVFYTDSLETKLKEKEKQALGDDPAPDSDKPPFNLAASINKISQKLFKKDLIKVKEAEEPAFQRGYTPPQPTTQPMQYVQPQQPYPGMQQQYPQQGYPQYPQQTYPQQMYQQQPYQGMQQQYPQQGYLQYPQQTYPQQMYQQQPYQGMQQYPQQAGQQMGSQQMGSQQMGGQPQYYPMQGQQQLPMQQSPALPQAPVQQAPQNVPSRPVAAGGTQQVNPAAPQQHTPKH